MTQTDIAAGLADRIASLETTVAMLANALAAVQSHMLTEISLDEIKRRVSALEGEVLTRCWYADDFNPAVDKADELRVVTSGPDWVDDPELNPRRMSVLVGYSNGVAVQKMWWTK